MTSSILRDISTGDQRVPTMNEADEIHLRFLQSRSNRLDNDWAFSELSKFVRYLDRKYGVA